MGHKANDIFASMSGDDLADKRCPYCLSNIWMRKEPDGIDRCQHLPCVMRRIDDKVRGVKVYKADSDSRKETSLDAVDRDLVSQAERLVANGRAPAKTLERLSVILAKRQITDDDKRQLSAILYRYARR